MQVNQKYALSHQMVVVECLEDPDETLKRKTLDLLFAMTNATNVVFVTDTLISHLKSTTDVPFRAGLVERLTQLAERYAPDNNWYIRTMNAVFELGGDLVRPDVAHNLMRLIAEGSGEDEDVDMALRKYAATQYYGLLAKPLLPDILMQVVCWVLGEYGYLCTDTPLDSITERLCDTVERQFSNPSTRCWVVSALCKLVAQMGELPEQVAEVAAKYVASSDVALSKYCVELQALASHMGLMKAALPVDASCEDIETDETSLPRRLRRPGHRQRRAAVHPRGERPDELAVDDSRLAAGASKQQPPPAGVAGGMRFEEYEKAEAPRMESMTPTGGGGGGNMAANYSMPQQEAAVAPSLTGLNTSGVAQKWGANGFQDSSVTQPQPPPTAMPPPSAPGYGGGHAGAAASNGGGGGYGSGGYTAAAAVAPATAPLRLRLRRRPPRHHVSSPSARRRRRRSLAASVALPRPRPRRRRAGRAAARRAAAPPPDMMAGGTAPVKEKKKKKDKAAAGGAAAAAPEVDLLGGLFDDAPPAASATPVTATAAPPAAPPPGAMDLLGGLFDAPAAPPAGGMTDLRVTPPPAAMGMGGGLGSEMGGGMGMGMGAAAPVRRSRRRRNSASPPPHSPRRRAPTRSDPIPSCAC